MTAEQDAIGLCLAGRISPPVALARLLLGGASPDSLAAALAARRPADPAAESDWRALQILLQERRQMLARLSAEIARFQPQPHNHPMGETAAFFDRAVSVSPEASVALYSLGDPDILARATAEIVDWLDKQGWLEGADILDLGCGIGRLAAALAARGRTVLGLDVSSGMVAEARRRCAGIANLRLDRTDGTHLDALPGAAFDVVLAADTFPYVLQAGPVIVANHLRGAARILRPRGRLVILNLSYGRDLAADCADAAAWAAEYGFKLRIAGERPFTLWDGSAFVLQRSPA